MKVHLFLKYKYRYAVFSSVIIALVIFAVASCGQPQSDDTPTQAPADTPTPVVAQPTQVPANVVWTVAIPDDVTTRNIWDILGANATAYNFAVFLNAYPNLMVYSDQRFDWVPFMADGLPGDVIQEGSSWTVTAKVKDGLQWSDGDAMDANDIAFTVNTALQLELTGNWAGALDANFIERAEAVDDLTIKYYFKQKPGLSVWQFGTALLTIVPEHYWRPIVENIISQTDDALERRNSLTQYAPVGEPVGGPAQFRQWEPGAFVSLTRNDLFSWRNSVVKEYSSGAYEETVQGETFTAYGEPTGEVDLEITRNLEQSATNFSVFNSQDSAILALRSGEVDYFLSPLGLSTGLRNQVQGQPGIQVFDNPSNGFRYLAFNFRRPPNDDINFRTAVATLIDKELLTNNILQGAAQPIYTFVPEGNSFWYNPDVTQTGKDLDRPARIAEAVRILKGAGYSWSREPVWDESNLRVVPGEDLRMPNGELIPAMEILSPGNGYDPLRATSAIWIERWLTEAGIPVTAKLTGFNEIVARVFEDENFDFDMWILGWGLTPYPDHLVDFFVESQTNVGGLNAGGFVSQTHEDLSAKFQSTTDVDEARDIVFRMQENLSNELPYVVLFAVPVYEAYRTEAFDFAYTDVLDGVQNLFSSTTGPLSDTAFSVD